MNIKSIKIYQAIQFDKSSHTYFTVEKVNGKPGVEISLRQDLGMVEIKSKSDHALIPFANVASIHPWTQSDDQKLEEQNVENSKLVTPSKVRRPR